MTYTPNCMDVLVASGKFTHAWIWMLIGGIVVACSVPLGYMVLDFLTFYHCPANHYVLLGCIEFVVVVGLLIVGIGFCRLVDS